MCDWGWGIGYMVLKFGTFQVAWTDWWKDNSVKHHIWKNSSNSPWLALGYKKGKIKDEDGEVWGALCEGLHTVKGLWFYAGRGKPLISILMMDTPNILHR